MLKDFQAKEFANPTGNSFSNGNSKVSNALNDTALVPIPFLKALRSQVVKVSYTVANLARYEKAISVEDLDKIEKVDPEMFDDEIILNIGKLAQRDSNRKFQDAMSSGKFGSLD